MPATLVTSDPATGLRRGPIRWPHGTVPTPFGCRRCGHAENRHGLGWHQWERPTRAQILARMKARRAARLAARGPLDPDTIATITASAGQLHRQFAPAGTDAVNDTLPQWLLVRFGKGGLGWHELDADTRSWWAHEAQAVRRAVARNGFKQPGITPSACGERLREAVCVSQDPDHWRHVTADGDYWISQPECPHDNCEQCEDEEPSLHCGATAADGTACGYIAQHRRYSQPHTFEPTPSA